MVDVRGSVGPLRLDLSRTADVVRFAGHPDYRGIGTFRPLATIVPRFLALGYDCRRVKFGDIPTSRTGAGGQPVLSHEDCVTVYFINLRTQAFAFFFSSSPLFRTPRGTRPGMPWSQMREHGRTYVNCDGLWVNGSTATLSVTNVGGKEPEGDPRPPISGGHVFDLALESVRDPVSFECW